MVKEILKNRPLFNECIEVLEAIVLPNDDSDKMTYLFNQMYPITKWGKIDWDKIRIKKHIGVDPKEIIPALQALRNRPFDTQVYIDWSDGGLPVIQADLEHVAKFFDDLTCVTFEKFLFNPYEGYIIEILPGDDMTVGILDSH